MQNAISTIWTRHFARLAMVAIQTIDRDKLEFPCTSEALSDPNGLLAVGGDLSLQRLLNAYQRGIFPWYEEAQPIMWWSPDPRAVLFPEELNISRSLRKTMRQTDFRISADTAFQRVVAGCAAPRGEDSGTWITHAMRRAYTTLFGAGHAHSIEVWAGDKTLVGGLYGVALGQVFYGESMFSRRANASKMALVSLVEIVKALGYHLLDCQVESDHLNSMGARCIPRLDFERFLAQTVDTNAIGEHWHFDKPARTIL